MTGKTRASYYVYRAILWMVRTVYPRIEIVGTENLPQEPALIVGNHAQMNGPIASQLYFPGKQYTWCAGQMMSLPEVPAYAFADFWSEKPSYIRWLYKILSYLIAPLSVCVFNNAATIPVYHDARAISTFKETVHKLEEGASVVIFPEHGVEYNNIVYDFQTRFVDVASLYHKRTGQELAFVPIYIAPRLHKMVFGKPITYCSANPKEEERQRICRYLMEEITALARALPPHTVVPYKNIAKQDYPTNYTPEENADEKTGC